MLSDEEKQALDYLQLCYDLSTITNESLSKLGTVLNLIENLIFKTETQKELLKYKTDKIEKQSKEIEELKEKNKILGVISLSFNEIQDRDKKWKDKIKAKIEELEEEKEFYNKDEDREWGKYNSWDWINRIINEFQSLLEKE